MSIVRIAHPGGPWVQFDTATGTVVDGTGNLAELVDRFTDDRWRPAAEAPMVTLDHSTGVLCLLVVERAAMFHRELPPAGWEMFDVNDDGTVTEHVPPETELIPTEPDVQDVV